jgi:hypothetical protein
VGQTLQQASRLNDLKLEALRDEPVDVRARDGLEIFRLNAADVAAGCEQARDRLASFPVPDPEAPEHWGTFEILTGQIRVLLGYIREVGVRGPEPEGFRALVLATLRYSYAADLGQAGYIMAGEFQRRWTEDLGPEHHDRLAAVERYAALCLLVRAQDEAIRLLKDVHLLRARLSGPRDSGTLSVAADLCCALNQSGDHESAWQLSRDTVPVCISELGEDSDTTLRAISGFAGALRGLGSLSAALAAFGDVHEKYARTRGTDHLSTLRAADDVAITAYELEDYEAKAAH